jgi:protein tyrosine phosphatase
LEPTKYEYKKLKERDQRKHVLKIHADVARRRDHLQLNRFINIYPYDFNRIKLQVPVSGSDYLNGSYISGPKSVKNSNDSSMMMETRQTMDYSKYENISFLATQGPLPETLEHHWQAIYENDVDIIVMLTKMVEGARGGQPGNKKCDQYWPSGVGETTAYGTYDVTLVSEEHPRAELIKRQLYLLDTREMCDKRRTGKFKSATHLHYVGWPDYGVPEENNHIVELVKDVRRIIKDDTERTEKCNILVHCSAGVGRTGTFIALYQLMEKIENILMERQMPGTSDSATTVDGIQHINIFSTVYGLRSKRVEMVQSWVQYKYLYASVSAYAAQINGSNTPDVEESDYVNYK